jgi:hypothetical protein
MKGMTDIIMSPCYGKICNCKIKAALAMVVIGTLRVVVKQHQHKPLALEVLGPQAT